MKQPVFFPLYNIHSDLVKSAIGLKDNRSVEQFFREAGVEVRDVGGKRMVTCEDLVNISKPQPVFVTYKGKSRKFDDLE